MGCSLPPREMCKKWLTLPSTDSSKDYSCFNNYRGQTYPHGTTNPRLPGLRPPHQHDGAGSGLSLPSEHQERPGDVQDGGRSSRRRAERSCQSWQVHYNDVIMGAIASQITSLTIVYSTVYLGPDQRKHQGSASLAFVRGIHRGPVNSPHKWPVTRKMFPFDDVIMRWAHGKGVHILDTRDNGKRKCFDGMFVTGCTGKRKMITSGAANDGNCLKFYFRSSVSTNTIWWNIGLP